MIRQGLPFYQDIRMWLHPPMVTVMRRLLIQSLFVWDTAGKLLFQTPASQARWNAALSYSADGSRLIAFAPDRIGVDVYDTSDWTLVRRIRLDEVEDAAISPDGLVLAGVNPLRRHGFCVEY